MTLQLQVIINHSKYSVSVTGGYVKKLHSWDLGRPVVQDLNESGLSTLWSNWTGLHIQTYIPWPTYFHSCTHYSYTTHLLHIQIFLSSFPSFTWVKIKTKSLPIVETKTQLSFMHAQTKSTIVLFELLLPIHSFIHSFIHPSIHSIQSMKPGREPTVKESPKNSVLICQSSSLHVKLMIGHWLSQIQY